MEITHFKVGQSPITDILKQSQYHSFGISISGETIMQWPGGIDLLPSRAAQAGFMCGAPTAL